MPDLQIISAVNAMKKKLKIAQLAPFEERVPPKKYGGTELVVYNLTEGLVKYGHCVTLFASGDSRTSAKLFSILPRSLRLTKIGSHLKAREAYKLFGLGKILIALEKERYDIIHNHIGWRILPFASLFKTPMLTTLHAPLNINYHKAIYQKFPHLSYVSISKNQRQPLPKLNFVANVYNGIDIDIFPFNEKSKDYLAFLGRMSPEKGPVEAIKIAKKAKMGLIMAAKVDVVDKKYFSENVKPLLDGKQIKFIGEVGHKGKVKLLRNALALLAPIQWREPFGLYMTEAMACGTPVIVFDQGSAREVVDDGKTGFVVKNITEAVRAINNISKIKRQDCRSWVEKKFSAQKMLDEYEKIYSKLLKTWS